MNLLKLYKNEAENPRISIFVMAMISGVAQGALLGIITTAAATVSYDTMNFRYFLLFIITFAVVILGKRYSLIKLTEMMEDIIERIRTRISLKIRDSELIFLENIEKGDIYTSLTRGTNLISEAAVIIINACQSAIIVFFCLLFVAFISKPAFFITVGAMGLAIVNYSFRQNIIDAELRETGIKEGQFFDMLNQILGGFKELKMNRKKRDDYFEYFKKLAVETKELKIRTGFKFVTELMYSQIFFYTLIAIIIFILPRFDSTGSSSVIQITAAVLFIMGPTNAMVSAIPIFARANIAIENLYGLESRLDEAGRAFKTDSPVLPENITVFNEIRFENISFSYFDKYNTPLFTVGPVTLSVRKGEIVFIVGGNGSGKSTFLKLLTGLYYPISGNIKIDGQDIDKMLYPSYRELFSVIFGDFHLFRRLYGLDIINEDKIRELLKIMGLDKKTAVIDGEFTNTDLSTGQRKRIAMIVSLLDDKPILVFDEWAADQDSEFRKYFYEVLLKELKNQGKTVIAVSHDDRYFHFADRVFKMEFGKFSDEKTI